MRYIFEASPQGDMVALRRLGGERVGGGKRKDITTFSRQSRSRLMKRIAQVQRHRMPLFVTLTYPSEYPVSYLQYKADLHNFLMVLKYRWPDFGAIWKLEYQDRGAAHYHLMLWGVSHDDALEQIPHIWYRIAGDHDINHLLFHKGKLDNKPCVELIRSWNGVRCYASKYLCKLTDDNIPSGRYWGCVGKVPLSPLLQMRIDLDVALKFRRAYRRYSGMKNRRFGFWAFGYCPDWLKYIDEYQTMYEQQHIPPPFPPGWWRDKPVQEDDFF